MKKLKLVMLSAFASLFSSSAFAQFTSDAEYILQDVKTGRYLGGANSWGTQASLLDHGQQLKLTYVSDGVYTIDSHAYNNASQHFFGGTYTDSGSTNIYFTAVGDYYALSTAEGSNYITYLNASQTIPTVTNTGASVDDAIKFRVLAVENLKDNLSEGDDATFLVKNWNFSRNQNSSYYPTWTGSFFAGGANDNMCAEKYHATFDVYQTISVPNGTYKAVGQGFYRQDGSDNDNLPVFYANSESVTLPIITRDAGEITQNLYSGSTYNGGNPNNMVAASGAFTQDLYLTDTIEVTVTTGSLTLGYKLENNTALWSIFDKIQLFYGKGVDLSEYISGYESAFAAAETALASKMNADVRAELEAVYDQYAGNTYSTGDEYAAASAALQTAVNNANTSINAYKTAKSTIDNIDDLLTNSNFFTASALTTFKTASDDFAAKYEAESLTNSEATAFQSTVFGSGAWHASNTVDDLLLSSFGTTDYNGNPYINTWSTEGNQTTDGSGMTTPFFEYWTGDGNSLSATTQSGTLTGLAEGLYQVSALVRVRIKNGSDADAYGITMSANGDNAVDVCGTNTCADGTQFRYGSFRTTALVKDGQLVVSFNVAEDNNISWLAYKNVLYTKLRDLTDEEKAVAPTSIVVNASSTNLYAGETTDLSLTFAPDNATTTGTWSSSNTAVATVADGVVTAVASGSAIITYTSSVNSEVSGSVAVNVSAVPSVTVTDFTSTTPAGKFIYTYASDVKDGGVSGAQDVVGFNNIAGAGSDGNAAGVFTYGETTGRLGGDSYLAPDATSTTTTNALGLVAVWGATSEYGLDVTLPAGTYTMTVPTTNISGTASVTNLTGVVIGSTATYASNTSFGVGSWVDQKVKFTLESSTDVTLTIGYKSNGSGSGANPHLFYDGIVLSSVDADMDVVAANVATALAAVETAKNAAAEEAAAAALAEAKTNKLNAIAALSPVGSGIFQYSSAAVERANAAVEAATTIDDVEAVSLPIVTAPSSSDAYQLSSANGNFVIISGGVKLVSKQEPVYFTQNSDGTFTINNGTEYVVSSTANAWTLTSTETAADATSYTVVAADGGITIQSANGYFGMDNDEAGASLYRNKAATVFAIASYEAPVSEIALNDDEEFSAAEGTYDRVTYTRQFNNTKWQSLYLPFSFDVDAQSGLTFASVNDVNAYDLDDDGEIDKSELEYRVYQSGSTVYAFNPVLVKASSVGEYVITSNDNYVGEEQVRVISLSSTVKNFDIYGSLSSVSAENLNGSYAFANGSLCKANGESGLAGYRWTLKMENKSIDNLDLSSATNVELPSVDEVSSDDYTFADHTTFTASNTIQYNSLVYNRKYGNTYWQTLCVPFSISYDDAKAVGLSLAKINDVNLYDNDEDGVTDEFEIEIIPLGEGGKTIPGVPYLIKANKAETKSLVMSDPTIYNMSEDLTCSNANYNYTFIGTTAPYAMSNGGYTINGGQIMSSTSTLSAERWYMTIDDKYNSRTANYRIRVVGSDDVEEFDEYATGVDEIELADVADSEAVFTVDGRRVDDSNLPAGVYIKAGKKFIVK